MKTHILPVIVTAMFGSMLLLFAGPITTFAQPADLPGISDPLYLTPIADPGAITKFVNALPVVKQAGWRIDAVADPHLTITAAPCRQDMLGTGHMTTLLGFAAGSGPVTHPGPTIVAKKNTPVSVTWINDLGFTYPLPIDTSIMWAYTMPPYNTRTITNNGVPFVPHLHGGHTNADYDGTVSQWWTPLFHSTQNPLARGADFVTNVFAYDNSQEAATLWYHDHSHGITRLQAYMGLAGFYFVRDDNELGLITANHIPSGDQEIELAIQDKTFWPNGQLAIPNVPSVPGLRPDQTIQPEMFGDVICVNGKAWPYLNVDRRQYRFRFLNASDSRFYHVWLDTGGVAIGFNQVGSDDGLLRSPVPRDSMLMGCGERYDIVIDFSHAKLAGKTITLRNDARAPYPTGDPTDANNGVIMQFRVGTAAVVDPVDLPSTLRPSISPLSVNGPTRKLILTEVEDEYGRTTPMLGTAAAGKLGYTDPTTETIKLNDVELWEIYNTTADAHPMHLHLVSFQIVSRQSFTCTQNPTTRARSNIVLGTMRTVPDEQKGWKDTDVMYPGEVTRIRAKFDKPGSYLWHCHILSHEENDMMRKFYVRRALVAPLLASPADEATGIARRPVFTWNPVPDAATYTFQLSTKSSFSSYVVNQSGVADTTYTPAAVLANGTDHYWRVRADNADGAGPWADFSFTTLPSTDPTHFLFTSETGRYKTVTIASTATLTLDGVPLVNGDEIGVFTGAGLCVGGVVWHLATTSFKVWGDDTGTPAQDGMLAGDTLYYRLWKPSTGLEYIGAVPTYSSGTPVYTTGTTAAVSALRGYTYPVASQQYLIPPGWNLFSTYIRPANTAIENICAPFASDLLLVKNGTGLVYWPAMDIHTLTTWNNAEGYQVYMTHAGTANFGSTIERPETKPVALSAGWNMIAYLRYSEQAIDVSLASIAPQLVFAKDNYGNVYWPAYGLNSLDVLSPGKAYQAYLSAPGTLTYPANAVLPPRGIGSLEPLVLAKAAAGQSGKDGNGGKAGKHFASSAAVTGSSATLLLRFREDVKELDEVAVNSPRGRRAGTGVITQQQAVVTIWGDDIITREVEGAQEGDALTLSYWSVAEKAERRLIIDNLMHGTDGAALGSKLEYRTDAILVADVRLGALVPTSVAAGEEIPTDFLLGQNYPNPFNPATKIVYGLPRSARVTLDVYDVLGQRVGSVIDEVKPAGYHEAAFDASHLSSGIYVYRLAAGDFVRVRKMVVVR